MLEVVVVVTPPSRPADAPPCRRSLVGPSRRRSSGRRLHVEWTTRFSFSISIWEDTRTQALIREGGEQVGQRGLVWSCQPPPVRGRPVRGRPAAERHSSCRGRQGSHASEEVTDSVWAKPQGMMGTQPIALVAATHIRATSIPIFN